ncbi:MAG: DUF2835 family protein [Reinekea sp.]
MIPICFPKIFPSRILQPFVTRQGIHGTFRIYFDQYHKFQRIEQL